MHHVNRLGAEQRKLLAGEFRKAMRCASDIFGDRAFRKWRGGTGSKSPINKALFETVAVNLAILDDHQREALVTSRDKVLKEFFDLMKDWDFDRAISVATGDTKKVRKRFTAMAELFRGVVGSD
jgi:hypothetical protein